MARRDRRRGGAHSAPRGGNGKPRANEPAETPTPEPETEPEAEAEPTGSDAPDAGAAESGPADEPVGIPGAAEAVAVPEVALTRKARRADRRKHKQKRGWLDRVLLSAVVLVSLVLVLVGVSYGYIQYRFHQVSKVTVKHLKTAPAGQPFNVLLIGSDSRVGESAADAAHFGDPTTQTGQRSDVVKILHVEPATGAIRIFSIPRDTMVQVAGDTSQIGNYNRINATYNNGPDQLVQTIEADFGIPISHVVQIDFAGFRGAVDAIGGIYLNFPYPAQDAYTGLNITTTGCQHVNGGYSLAVARSRHYEYFKDGYWQYDGTSDFGRIQRQNAFLKALINQAETKYNPLTLNAFIGSVVQGVTIDSTFTVAGLISLAREFHTFSSSSLVTATLPTYGSDSSVFGYLGSVLYVQQPDADQAVAQFLGQSPESITSPPPDPYGSPATTTTTTTVASSGGSTPPTSSSSTTTTTAPSDFNPTPCTP